MSDSPNPAEAPGIEASPPRLRQTHNGAAGAIPAPLPALETVEREWRFGPERSASAGPPRSEGGDATAVRAKAPETPMGSRDATAQGA